MKNEVKHVGVRIDDKLTFKKYSRNRMRGISSRLYQLLGLDNGLEVGGSSGGMGTPSKNVQELTIGTREPLP